MKKAVVAISFVVIVSTLCAVIIVLPENATAATLFVGGSGPGNFTTIQGAIDFGTPGDIIYVYNGTYFEEVVVSKTLDLRGEDPEATIIEAGGVGSAVRITADWVNFTGFSIRNASNIMDEGISLTGVQNCLVANNNISNNGLGIFLVFSENNTLRGNNVMSNYAGIFSLYSFNNTIAENTILNNEDSGISLEFGSNTMVVDNTISRNEEGGIRLRFSTHITLTGNIMIEDGILMTGDLLEQWNTHIIDISNTVNSKPVHYWKNVTGGSIPSGAGQVILANCTGVTVVNQNVSGGSTGIGIGFSSWNTIADNIASSNDLYGIYSRFSDNNTIVNNTFSHSGIGASFYYSPDNVLTSNSASNHWEAFRIYYSDNCIIESNTVFSNAASGFFLDNSNNITFMKNRVSNNRDGFFIQSSDHNTFANNTAVNNLGRGIYLTGSDYGIFVDNNLSSNLDGIHIGFSHFGTIMDNIISSSYWAAIFVASSRNTVITNNIMAEDGLFISGNSLEYWNTHTIDMSNTVNGNPVYYWQNITGGTVPSGAGQVILANCTSVTVENQNVSHGSGGIELGFSSSNTVVNNTASHGFIGIYLSDSGNNTIANNTASDNYKGIAVRWSSDNNVLVNNTVMLNHDYGLQLVSSNGNLVYHNDLVDNAPRHASDNTGTNYWDNGYPSGGNYWSDYQGIDNCSGPNQDVCPDPDDIGDTPYSVGFLTQDMYPLMDPVGSILVRPPIILRADLSGANFENVTISWALSPDDGMGYKSVSEYSVYRNPTFDSGGSGYQLIATLLNGTSSFTDEYVGEGDPNNYFYQVCAVDVNNNSTCGDVQAGKFTRFLLVGLDVVSIPLILSDESVGTALQTVKFDKAWTYDSLSGQWKSYMTFKPYKGGLKTVNHKMSLWVNSTEGSNLTVAGIVPLVTTIQLKAGWNFVGVPSFNSTYSVSDLKAETGATRVEGLDPLAPPYFLRVMNDGEFLQAGYGYWVHVESDMVWIVQNS